MATMLETPSRVLRRIEAVEGQDMPSLPSLPGLEDSEEQESESNDESVGLYQNILPIHSTPATQSAHTMTTIRAPSGTSSTVRFAHSLASRTNKSASSGSRRSSSRQPPEETFDVSAIPSLPDMRGIEEGDLDVQSDSDNSLPMGNSKPAFVPEDAAQIEGEIDTSSALQLVSRSNSPRRDDQDTPHKRYDYSVSLRSERKPSPFDKMRNVSIRRPPSRTRTPSLTRATPSPSSSTSNSTPHSGRSLAHSHSFATSPVAASVPLPPSNNPSPAAASSTQEQTVVRENANEDVNPVVHQEESSQGTMNFTDTFSRAQDVSGQEQEDERDPTFSSDPPVPIAHDDVDALRSALLSSPAPSAVLTPTPALQLRPRARFAAALPVSTPRPRVSFANIEEEEEEEEPPEDSTQKYEAEDTATPHAHKRSFLLSVINSTARPKMRHTPHPHRSASGLPMTPGVNLQAAFAGVTPRPHAHRRASHPLAQAFPEPSDSQSAADSELAAESLPAEDSPRLQYDSGAEQASFVSSASSHDLTTHARANASFDPVLGLGERGHGVGRFNANKLNTYLHGLNRRLQQENETLVMRLKTYEEKYARPPEGAQRSDSPQSAPQSGGRRSSSSSGARRVSVSPNGGLPDVAEDRWIEEKAALDETVERLKADLQRTTVEKEKAQRALEDEQGERTRDKERWRSRMAEVEKGVSNIIQELENKLHQAQRDANDAQRQKAEAIREAEQRLEMALGDRKMLEERVKKAEDALKNGRELGGELNAMNERLSQVGGELRNANMQIRGLEEEVMRADEKIDDLEKQLREEKSSNAGLRNDLQAHSSDADDAQGRIRSLKADLQKAQEELHEAKQYVAQVDEDATSAVERIESLESQLAEAHMQIEAMSDELDQVKADADKMSDEVDKANELSRQMEEALEAAETKMMADQEEITALKAKLAELERLAERERRQDRSRSRVDTSQDEHIIELQAEIEALEGDLDDAHREIARLSALVQQSPARKAIDKAKDAKIELLEKERDGLLERIKSLRSQHASVRTPSKLAVPNGISPVQQKILSPLMVQSPKTPGGPLRDLSWLQSTVNDPTVTPLIAEIARLQQELDRANESIDDKLDKLGNADLGAVGLTQQLEDARSKIISLEDQVARLSRREGRRLERLQRVRCKKCRTKVDLRGFQKTHEGDESSLMDVSNMTLPSEPPTPPSKISESLRADLRKVNVQLSAMRKTWEGEKRQLLEEKAVLEDAANRLNAQVRDTKNEMLKIIESERAGERVRVGIQGELEQARRIIGDLENELQTERSRLRSLTAEQSRAQREKDEVMLQLRKTESDMTEVKQHLQRLKDEKHKLGTELRSNANADQRARLLENKVTENAESIEQLRQERLILATDYKELQGRYAKLSDRMKKLQDEHAASQQSHDEHRHQLNLRLLEIDDLRRALSSQADELVRVQSEKARLTDEQGDVARTVEALEADLRRVRRDAEAFGRDLKLLRAHKERAEEERGLERAQAERAQKQTQATIRLLREELEGERERGLAVDDQMRTHVCGADGQQIADIRVQHNKECKGLMTQIRYLKAKFTRESMMRNDLGFQKHYLLALLARLERNEQMILASIARIGFPTTDPAADPPKRRTLRSAALSVIFILRAKRASDTWREESSSRPALISALQDVRRRRVSVQDPAPDS